jgi:hypothetical protein
MQREHRQRETDDQEAEQDNSHDTQHHEDRPPMTGREQQASQALDQVMWDI